MADRVWIFDTTLRDGEQSPGYSMNLGEKLKMAEMLDQMGVDFLEAGFPAASRGDFEAVHGVAQQTKSAGVAGLCRALHKDIDAVVEALKPAARPHRAALAVLAAILVSPALTAAQMVEPLRFPPGGNTTSTSGLLKGPNEATRDYVVQADAGMQLSVALRTTSPGTYFSVLHPYGDRIYTNEGDDDRFRWSGRLIDGGAYRIRVFLDRASASAGRGANYTLNVTLEPPR